MNSLIIYSLNDNIKIGRLNFDAPKKKMVIDIDQNYQAKYQGVICELIENTINKGEFNIIFNREQLTLENTDDSFLRAFNQELFRLLRINLRQRAS